jgi:hypothetical protein
MRSLSVKLALALALVASCTLPSDEERDERDLSMQAWEDLDERATWELYQRYIAQGIDPCDPPPDPWHPFVKYGFCELTPEPIPDHSYDE